MKESTSGVCLKIKRVMQYDQGLSFRQQIVFNTNVEGRHTRREVHVNLVMQQNSCIPSREDSFQIAFKLLHARAEQQWQGFSGSGILL